MRPPFRVGQLRSLITIQVRAGGQDGFGEASGGWGDVTQVWASVQPLSGRELLSAQQVRGEVSHRVRCRYLAGITSAHRILYGGRVFDIQAVMNPEEACVSLEILCREGPTDG